jgi:hypothetical protein
LNNGAELKVNLSAQRLAITFAAYTHSNMVEAVPVNGVHIAAQPTQAQS